MNYSYTLALLRVDKRTKKSDEIEIKEKGPFKTMRECYVQASAFTSSLGDNSSIYDWFRTVAFLLYEEINIYSKGKKFHTMKWESEYETIQVIMSINDNYK